MSFLNDLDIEYGDDELELEIEHHDPEQRSRLREHGQQLLQDLEPGRVLDLLGR